MIIDIKLYSITNRAGRINYHRVRSLLAGLCLSCLSIASVNAASQDADNVPIRPLQLGLLPHLSSSLLLKKYQKLVNYLEVSLHRKVIIQTAPNFKTYFERVREGRFDLYLTAPHLAAYHEMQDGHRRVAGFKNTLSAVIAVAADSPYRKLSELQGKLIFAPDMLAVVTLQGEVTLNRNKVKAEIHYTPTHNNALHAVALGKADAAIAGSPAFKITNSSTKLKKPLRILAESFTVPQMMFMTPARVSDKEREGFKQVLLKIESDTTGKAFIQGVPFGSLGSISDKEMQSLSDMVELLKRRISK